MKQIRTVALSGGVGGAKLALGLDRILAPGELMVIANSGDDFEHLGLHISPDIDTLLYTLSARANADTGWGRAGETWSFMSALEELAGPGWFRLGDKDLAVHVWRTLRLRQGMSLCEVTRELAARLEVATIVVPMTDSSVRTRVRTNQGWLDFQEYFVRQRCLPEVQELSYIGAASAEPAPGVVSALRDPRLDAIFICPSNPYLSIDPILALTEIRAALGQATAPVIAISPVVGGRAIKGPTAKIMRELGVECTVENIARHYRGLIDGLVIDAVDGAAVPKIETLGIPVSVEKTVMQTLGDRCDLARQVLSFAERLRKAKPEGEDRVGIAAG